MSGRGGAASLDYFVRNHDLFRKAGLVASLKMALLGIFSDQGGGGGDRTPHKSADETCDKRLQLRKIFPSEELRMHVHKHDK